MNELEEDFATLNCNALRRISADDRRRLFPFFEARRMPAGTFFYRPGEVPPGLFVLLGGDVLHARKTNHRLARSMRVLERGDIFGEAALVDGAPIKEVARAEGPVVALLLLRSRAAAAIAAVPALGDALRTHARLQEVEGDFIAAMQRTRLFQGANPHHLSRLFHQGEMRALAAGEPAVRQGDPPAAVFFVVDGELHSHHEAPGASAAAGGATEGKLGAPGGALVDMLFAGDVFGDVPIVTSKVEATTVTAMSPATLLCLSPALLRGAHPTSDPATPVPMTGAFAGELNVLLLQSPLPPAQLPAPLAILSDLLAQTLRRDHADPVLVLRLTSAKASAAAPRGDALPSLGEDGVARQHLVVGDDPAALVGAIREAIVRFRDWLPSQSLRDPPAPNAAAFVFLDATELAAPIAELRPVLTRIVLLSRDTLDDGAALPRRLTHVPVLHTALLDGQRVERVAEPAHRSRAARVRLDRTRLAAAQQNGRCRLTDLDEATRATLSRWGRAATDRRVGIALGGGGAYGYAHVALIEAILDRGVPIDLVSGASFGAVVGAYYCAEGRAGLAHVIRDGRKIEWSTQLAIISSWALAIEVDTALGRRRLEDLEVPLLPVATDVANGTQYLPSVGTLGYGVRASGSFPGIFTPTTTPTGRFVDGGMINNVPDSVLHVHGAALAIASNIVASPAAVPIVNPPFGELGRVLYEFNPIGRVRDLVRSLFIMFHTTGDRQALFADVTYESEQVPYMPWEFQKGAAIVELARPGAVAAAERARRKWDTLRGRAPSLKSG